MMKRTLSAVAVALFALYSVSGCGDSRTAGEYLTSAQQYEAKGDHAAAIIELKNALLQEPDNAEGRLRLGEAYLARFQWAAAEKELRRALALENTAEVRLLLARALYQQQKMLEIVEDIPDAGPSTADDQPELLYLRVFAMQQLNKPGVDALVARLQQEAQQSPYASLARALMLSRERQFDEARALVQAVLAGAPEQVYALELDGNLAAVLQDNDAAIAGYRKLVELVPASYYYKLILAGLLTTNQAYEEALPIVDNLLKAFPNQAQSNYYRAMIAYADDELKLAAEHADRALASFPEHAPARLLSASAYYRLGRFEQANNALEPISRRLPANHPAKRLWAAIQLQLGDDEQALKTLEDVSEFSPQDANLVAAVGLKLAQSGHYDDAVQLLRKVLPQDDSGRIQSQLGMTLMMSGESAEGLKELEELVAAQPELGRAQVLLFNGYLKAGEYGKAQAQVDELKREEGETPAVLTLQGIVAAVAGEVGKAQQSFTAALEQNPDYLTARLYLANLLLTQDKPDQAREHYKKALATAPRLYGALGGLMRTAASEPLWQENLEFMQAAWDQDTSSKPVRYLLAHTLFNLKEWKQLIALYPNATSLPLTAVHTPEEYLLVARAFQLSGESGQGMSMLRRWVQVQPDSGPAHFHLGSAYLQQRNMTEAEARLADAARLQPESVVAQLALAKVQLANGKLDAVGRQIPQLETKIANQPGFLRLKGSWLLAKGELGAAQRQFEELYKLLPIQSSLLMLANAQWRNDQPDDAIQLLDTWLKAHSDDSRVMISLANYQLQRARYDEAAKWYQGVLERQPDSLAATNNLAWILAEQGKVKRALTLIESAVARWPDEANVLDTYGVILLKNKSYQKAVDILKRATTQISDNPSIQYHYAQALLSVDRHDEARMVLQKILTADSVFPEREQAEKLLKEGA